MRVAIGRERDESIQSSGGDLAARQKSHRARCVFGADSLCWHARLMRGMPVESVLTEARAAGAGCVDLTLHYLEQQPELGPRKLTELAAELGISLFASGHGVSLGQPGTNPAEGARRVAEWLEVAAELGSPVLKVFAGFYRSDLASRDLIKREAEYLTAVLRAAVPAAERNDVRVLVENCSDFTPEELEEIITEVDSGHVGVFLDLINPIAVFHEPVAMVTRLAPLAGPTVHVKDYRLLSVWTRDRFHRFGFDVRWCYPGEGVADLPDLLDTLLKSSQHDQLFIVVEGLADGGLDEDQIPRLRKSFETLARCLESPALDE